MRLTPADLNEIRRIVDDHWTSLMVEAFGTEAVGLTAADLDRLVKDGLLEPAAVGVVDPIGDARWLGSMGERMRAQGIDPTTATAAKVATYARNAAALYPVEVEAVKFARASAGQWCKGLGNRMADQIISATNAEDMALRQKMITTIQTETARAIEERATVRKLASNLGHATGDWARDWRRIAATEMQTAHQTGVATAIARDFGPEALAAKIPTPLACKRCRDLYLDASTGRPRIFKLSDLLANGTNVGRKSKDWLPVVGATHPHCLCFLTSVNPGWAFDDDWTLRPPKKE
jgi:hypothetical protein